MSGRESEGDEAAVRRSGQLFRRSPGGDPTDLGAGRCRGEAGPGTGEDGARP